MNNPINVYQAIDQMRDLTRKGKYFSFSFMSYNSSKGYSHGIVEVTKAKLGKKDRSEHNRNADFMENYIDCHTGDQHKFWKPLLMTFNNQIVELT